jgi:hypothetical protein
MENSMAVCGDEQFSLGVLRKKPFILLGFGCGKENFLEV